jgi:hypothetical protein
MFLGRDVVVRGYRCYGGETRVVDVCERLLTKEAVDSELGNVFDCLHLLYMG